MGSACGQPRSCQTAHLEVSTRHSAAVFRDGRDGEFARGRLAGVPEKRVRQINVTGHGPALDTLASGFAQDRGMRRVMAPPFEQSSREFLEILLNICLDSGAVWATPGMESVACWTTPAGRNGAALFSRHAERITELTAGDPAIAAAEAQFYERHRPQHPVWFLCTVATRPEARGRGLAKAVITPGLQAADDANVPTFLETDNPSNIGLYESLGFKVVAQELLDDALFPTSMIRVPG